MTAIGLAAVVVWTSLAWAAAGAEITAVPAYRNSATEAAMPRKITVPGARHVHALRLPPVAAERLEREYDQALATAGLPRIGFARPVEAMRTSSRLGEQLQWEKRQDGSQVAAFSLTSPGAAGLRLGLLVESLPAEARLRFFSQADRTAAEEISGAAILALIRDNLASGDDSEDARTYWTPAGTGEELTVEIELPPGVTTGAVRLSVPRLSHLIMPPEELEPRRQARAASSCNLDASCYLSGRSNWYGASQATALMSFVRQGNSYGCTGTLIADRGQTGTPYLYTANHCIASQTVASTLNTYWFYRSNGCSLLWLPSVPTVKLTGGATLLFNHARTDTTLLRLKNAAPNGAVFASWNATLPAIGTAIAGLHHARSEVQKISFGNVSRYINCQETNTDPDALSAFSSCVVGNASNANLVAVRWRNGVVETGSSGSGLWVDQSFTGYSYLVGQLSGLTATTISAACSMDGEAWYGRFDLAYEAGMKQWLEFVPSYALNVVKNGSGTVTELAGGINCGSDCTESYPKGSRVELTAMPKSGHALVGWNDGCWGSDPVCKLTINADTQATAVFSNSKVSGLGAGAASSSGDYTVHGTGSGIRASASIAAIVTPNQLGKYSFGVVYVWAEVRGVGKFCYGGQGWTFEAYRASCLPKSRQAFSEVTTVSIVDGMDLSDPVFDGTTIYMSVGDQSKGIPIFVIR